MTDAGFCTDAVCVVLRTGVTNDCTLSGILVSSLCPGRCVSCTGGGDGGGGHGFFARSKSQAPLADGRLMCRDI